MAPILEEEFSESHGVTSKHLHMQAGTAFVMQTNSLLSSFQKVGFQMCDVTHQTAKHHTAMPSHPPVVGCRRELGKNVIFLGREKDI